MIEPPLGEPELDGVVLEGEEAQAERSGGGLGGDRGAVDRGGDPRGVDVARWPVVRVGVERIRLWRSRARTPVGWPRPDRAVRPAPARRARPRASRPGPWRPSPARPASARGASGRRGRAAREARSPTRARRLRVLGLVSVRGGRFRSMRRWRAGCERRARRASLRRRRAPGRIPPTPRPPALAPGNSRSLPALTTPSGFAQLAPATP